MRRGGSHGERGFTLLEVVIALAILALYLGVLLEVQVTSLHAAGRSRDMSIASMLARSKMIDVEQKLFDEGFTLGEIEEQGDFTDEGRPDFKWKYKVSEVELDLSTIGALCGEDDEEGACGGMLGGLGGMLEGLTQEIGRSVRVVELIVTWPDGKFTESMRVSALVTNEQFTLGPGAGQGQGTGQAPPVPGTQPPVPNQGQNPPQGDAPRRPPNFGRGE